MPTNVINLESPVIRDSLLRLNFVPFSEGPDYNQVGGLGLPVDIKLQTPLASSELTTIYDNREYYLSRLISNNRYRLTEYGEYNNTLIPIDTGVGGEYKSPTSLDDSAVGKPNYSFPFNGVKPIDYLTNLNMFSSPSEYVDVSSELTSLAQTINRYGNYKDENQNKGGIFGINKEIIDVIGSVVLGRQIGVTSEGVTSDFDIRSSLLGRTLG